MNGLGMILSDALPASFPCRSFPCLFPLFVYFVYSVVKPSPSIRSRKNLDHETHEMKLPGYLSGTSITSPSRTQKPGELMSWQSTTYSRALPVAGSRRFTFTRDRSEDDRIRPVFLRSGRSIRGSNGRILMIGLGMETQAPPR